MDKTMFEHEFEIVVPQNFEVCLERIDSLKKSGCRNAFFQSVDSFVYLRGEDAEFVLRQSAGRNAGYTVIKGVVEPLDDETTRVSGLANVEGAAFFLIFLTVVAAAFIIHDIRTGNGWVVAISAILYVLGVYQQVYYRNRLIQDLEKALRQ
jgi:hypothetical protein